MSNREPRALSGWQMVLVIAVIFAGTFGGAAWMVDKLLLDCAEQQEMSSD